MSNLFNFTRNVFVRKFTRMSKRKREGAKKQKNREVENEMVKGNRISLFFFLRDVCLRFSCKKQKQKTKRKSKPKKKKNLRSNALKYAKNSEPLSLSYIPHMFRRISQCSLSLLLVPSIMLYEPNHSTTFRTFRVAFRSYSVNRIFTWQTPGKSNVISFIRENQERHRRSFSSIQ